MGSRAFFILASSLAGCSALAPRPDDLPMPLPSSDFAIGLDTGLVWGDADALELAPTAGLEVSWLEHVYGLHSGLAVHPEADVARLSLRLEATVWYVALFGAGVRAGLLNSRPWNAELAEPAPVRPAEFTIDLTALVALPFAVYRPDGQGAFLILPYARPGLRLEEADRALSGIYEIGLMFRWTSFDF